MLVRCKVMESLVQNVGVGHIVPSHYEFVFSRREVCLDPWEHPDCAKPVGTAFGVSPINPVGWSVVPLNQGVEFASGERLQLVLFDPQTGWAYYRRPSDMSRQYLWLLHCTFRVFAEEW